MIKKGNKTTVILLVLAGIITAGTVAIVVYRNRKKDKTKQVNPSLTAASAVSSAVTSGYIPAYFPLRKGMYGEDVRILQAVLMIRGYNIGKWGTDGKFGADTLTAVREAFKDPSKNEVTEAEWYPFYSIYKIENNLPQVTVK